MRPKLLPTEWTAVIIVSALYFISAFIAQVTEIVLVNDIHLDAPQSVMGYQIPELLMDVIFLSWIYLALTSTIRILTEFKQTQKLSMYRWLTGTIYVFVFLFSLVTVIILLDKLGYLTWPWQWAWAQQVLWEILNFFVLICVCLICRPTDNSHLLAYASQIPTEDPDDDADYEEGGEEEEDNQEFEIELADRKTRELLGFSSGDGSAPSSTASTSASTSANPMQASAVNPKRKTAVGAQKGELVSEFYFIESALLSHVFLFCFSRKF